MPIRTKRWNDPVARDDGVRILITRYRPRGLHKRSENWDQWMQPLAPSKALHAAFYGKSGAPIGFEEYRARYLEEMNACRPLIYELALRVKQGETITLLCSSACVDPARCHRSLLKALIEAELPDELRSPPEAPKPGVVDAKYGKLKSWLE